MCTIVGASGSGSAACHALQINLPTAIQTKFLRYQQGVFDQAIPAPDIFLEKDIAKTLTSIECWLEQIFTVRDTNWEIVQELIQQYSVDDEKVLVKELSQKYLWSYKKTERMFVKYIGLTPRTVIKLLRFRRLMEAMKSTPGTLTSSAYQFGFFRSIAFHKRVSSFYRFQSRLFL